MINPGKGVALRTLSVVVLVVGLIFGLFFFIFTQFPQGLVSIGFIFAAVALWVLGSRVTGRA